MSDRDRREADEQRRRRAHPLLAGTALNHHVSLEPPAGADQLLSVSVGPGLEPYALWSTALGRQRLLARSVQSEHAAFQDSVTPTPAVATVHSPDTRILTRIPDLNLAHPLIQPLPDDETLLVARRASWRPGGADNNAIVVDASGARLRDATLGDGINSVQTTPSGEVWVAYADQGIWGNFGWGSPGPAPIGRSGIARFDSGLTLRWEYPADVDDMWGDIADCYALNVTDETAWAYYYTEFPIVRIDGDALAGWSTQVSGATALAVDDQRVLLAGGYGAERDLLVEGRLADSELEILRASRLTLPDGDELPANASLIGRGPDLTVIVGRNCYRLSLG